MSEALHRLAELMGILPEYWDVWGRRHTTGPETKAAILRAMGVEAGHPQALQEALRERLRPRELEPVGFAHPDSPSRVALRLAPPGTLPVEFTLKAEEGGFEHTASLVVSPEEEFEHEGKRWGLYSLELPPLRMGYYGLEVSAGQGRWRQRLVVAPELSYLPGHWNRLWGLTVAPYGLRSRDNWGVGELEDLKRLLRWVASEGGAFVGITPLHAIPNSSPWGISPYSPLSRLFRNPLYLSLREVEEFALVQPPTEAQLRALREAPLVQYEEVWQLKLRCLREMFEHFYRRHYLGDSPRGRAFKAYLGERGRALEDFCTFMALWERHQGGWQDWPQEFRSPRAPQVQRFRAEHRKEVLFHAYLQWLMHQGLKRLQEHCSDMPIGLYADLALGSLGGGADAWAYPEAFALGADTGAPPDEFNQKGQNWGFPPLSPQGLRDSAYEYFIQVIRANMEHAGLLRIDHALGLFRLFWIPQGMKPSEGAYVRYPWRELLSILALEAHRARCAIVAEDLGTVPPEVRHSLQARRMLSYRVFYYERQYPRAELTPPGGYPSLALCSVSTHDLPTLWGFWAGEDIRTKAELGLYPSQEALQQDLQGRRRDRELILQALKAQGLLPQDYQVPSQMNPTLLQAIYRYLARTPCLLLAVSLDDWLALRRQQNMPGTVSGYPNWQQKSPLEVEQLPSRAGGLGALLRKEDRGRASVPQD
jgi:4-alpha-glucanotransferase